MSEENRENKSGDERGSQDSTDEMLWTEVDKLKEYGTKPDHVKRLKEAGFYTTEAVSFASQRLLQKQVKRVSEKTIEKIKTNGPSRIFA